MQVNGSNATPFSSTCAAESALKTKLHSYEIVKFNWLNLLSFLFPANTGINLCPVSLFSQSTILIHLTSLYRLLHGHSLVKVLHRMISLGAKHLSWLMLTCWLFHPHLNFKVVGSTYISANAFSSSSTEASTAASSFSLLWSLLALNAEIRSLLWYFRTISCLSGPQMLWLKSILYDTVKLTKVMWTGLHQRLQSVNLLSEIK